MTTNRKTTSLLILNQIYEIRTVTGLASESDVDGRCDDRLKLIEIDAELPLEEMRRVILHELLHAYAYQSGLCEFVDSQAEEMFCQSLSGVLNSLMDWKFRE